VAERKVKPQGISRRLQAENFTVSKDNTTGLKVRQDGAYVHVFHDGLDGAAIVADARRLLVRQGFAVRDSPMGFHVADAFPVEELNNGQ
jgi:hypothetical protein